MSALDRLGPFVVGFADLAELVTEIAAGERVDPDRVMAARGRPAELLAELGRLEAELEHHDRVALGRLLGVAAGDATCFCRSTLEVFAAAFAYGERIASTPPGQA